MSSKKLVELFYDVVSPYSWLSFEVLCRYNAAGAWKMNLKLKPFFLGGVMQGSDNHPPGMIPNKGEYMLKDLLRLREHIQVPISKPKDIAEVMFKKGTLLAQRFLTVVDMKYPEFTEELSRQLWIRIWSKDQDITKDESFREAGRAAGISDDIIRECLSCIRDQDVKDRLKQYTQEALDNGAFGSPTIIAHVDGKKEMIFGSDRFPILANILGEEWKGPLVDMKGKL